MLQKTLRNTGLQYFLHYFVEWSRVASKRCLSTSILFMSFDFLKKINFVHSFVVVCFLYESFQNHSFISFIVFAWFLQRKVKSFLLAKITNNSRQNKHGKPAWNVKLCKFTSLPITELFPCQVPTERSILDTYKNSLVSFLRTEVLCDFSFTYPFAGAIKTSS